MNEYLDLFWTFVQIGGITFGGGYAMLPMLQREVVEHKKWATEEEMMDYYAVGQCTPGIIAINVATFIGKKVKGNLGGIVATLGVVTPPLIIICIISAFLQNFADYPLVQNAFAGIQVCVCILILHAVTRLFKKAVIDKVTLAIFAMVFLGSLLLGLSPIVYIIISAALGILVKNWEAKSK